MATTPLSKEIADHNVVKLGHKEGKTIQIGDLRFTWKTRPDDTGYQFAVYEMNLDAGKGLSLHKHPYAEFFYVVEGQMEFARLRVDGTQELVPCRAGECVTAPANAPHGFINQSGQPARFLSVAVHYHEALLNETGLEVNINDPLPTQPDPAQLNRFLEVAARMQGYNVEDGKYQT